MAFADAVTVTNGVASGTAGAPSAQVVSIQGVSGGTVLPTVTGLTTTGGASYSNTIAPATPAAVAVKTSPGNVYSVAAFNLLATPVYLKFWDTGSAPTLGTTAATYQFMVPGNTGGAGFVMQFAVPRSHANRIYYAVTNGMAAADNTAISAASVIIDVAYN